MSQAARLAHWLPTYSPAAGNIVVTTSAPNSNNVVDTAFGSAAGSGGVTDPTKVLKAGDTMTGALRVSDTTPSTSPATGALTVAGGIGIGGEVHLKAPISWHAQAAGDFYLQVFYNISAVVVGSIRSNDTATIYATSSDRRLKDDLQPFDAGPIIDQTNVYNFAWRATGERAYGVIAQEAIEIFPDAVSHNEAQDVWGIDYSKYVPLLLQEIKSLRARVAALETAAI